MKKILLLLLLILGLFAIYQNDASMALDAKDTLYSSLSSVPQKQALLLLGTAKYVKNGRKNYFYTYRIRATIALWKANKVKAIIVSGDNGTKAYDEATTMYDDLIQAGIPKRFIRRDYAGFRTLDSVVRAKAIFDLEDYIIVSQKFHLERALFIAKAKGQKAIGFIAKDLKNTPSALRMQVREYLARVKAFLDIYVLNTQPKFYGKKVKVEYKN